MTGDWIAPDRIDAHRLLRLEEALVPLPEGTTASTLVPVRSVEDVFRRGLISDVLKAPANVINTRLDSIISRLPSLNLGNNDELARWGDFAAGANQRHRQTVPFLGLSLQAGRAMLQTNVGLYLIRPLPFEDLSRRNDTHELLYFRDSGLHRRLIERSLTVAPRDLVRAAKIGVSLDDVRRSRLQAYQPKRWEAFVVVSILDRVGDRCEAFAYRNEETAEIDLILEWRDRSPAERWAIEVASRKFNGHPSDHFAGSCDHLGVADINRFVVFRADGCSGRERGRGGVRACALPRMLDYVGRRLG